MIENNKIINNTNNVVYEEGKRYYIFRMDGAPLLSVFKTDRD